jgi:type IV secretory pathway VirB10-like protein
MDLEVARKSLSKRSAFSTKKIAFVVVAGLVLVSGIALRASHYYFGETPPESEPATVLAPSPEAAAPPPAETTQSVAKELPPPPVTPQAAPAPVEPPQQARETPQADPEEDATGQAEQQDMPGSGVILVSRKPVEVLASPSATAPAMYGFPAGRPFRVIGREGSFVHIQDLRSSASGWIDATALAAPPQAAPAANAPSQAKPAASGKPATASADPKPKTIKKNVPVSVGSDPVATAEPTPAPRRPGLFGQGGLFGGIFRNN